MRISSLPTFLACPSSQLPIDHPYDPPSDAADLGTAAHQCLAAHVAGIAPAVSRIAGDLAVDADELSRLYSYGRDAWATLRDEFSSPKSEQPLNGDGIKGTADVVSWDAGLGGAAVLDWKTNRVKRSYREQLHGYAAAVAEHYGWPASGQIRVYLVWLRFREYEVATVTQPMVEALYERIAKARADIGKRYAPGEPCTYCKRQLVCEARAEYLRSACSAMVVVDGDAGAVSRDTVGKLYTRAKLLRGALNAYDAALRLILQSGPVDDGNGNTLELSTIELDTIAPDKAWPILIEHGLTTKDLAAVCTIGKTKALAAVAAKAPPRKGAAAKRELMEALRSAGAVSRSSQSRITVRKGAGL